MSHLHVRRRFSKNIDEFVRKIFMLEMTYAMLYENLIYSIQMPNVLIRLRIYAD